jgi:hypothetical protein
VSTSLSVILAALPAPADQNGFGALRPTSQLCRTPSVPSQPCQPSAAHHERPHPRRLRRSSCASEEGDSVSAHARGVTTSCFSTDSTPVIFGSGTPVRPSSLGGLAPCWRIRSWMRAPSAHDLGGGVCDDTCCIDATSRHRNTGRVDGDAGNRADVTIERTKIGCGEW